MNMESDGNQDRPRLTKAWLLTLVVVGLLLLVTGFYGEENCRGRHAWQKYRAELIQRGEPLEASAVIPPPVSDTENFAQTPFLAPLFDFVPGTQERRDTNGFARAQHFADEFNRAGSGVTSGKAPHTNSWGLARVDFAAWDMARQERKPGTQPVIHEQKNQADSAREILKAMAAYDPVIQEIREASQRPYSRFNLAYDTPNPSVVLLPHLAVLKQLCQVLQLRALVELSLGQSEQASQDVELMFKLIDATRNEPVVIDLLVRFSETQFALQTIQYGMAKQAWSESQLKAFQQRLETINFCADAHQVLEGERVLFGGGLIDYVRTARNQFNVMQSLGSGEGQSQSIDAGSIAVALVPSGWFYFEKVNYERLMLDQMEGLIDQQRHRISPAAVEQYDAKLQATISKRGVGTVLGHRVFLNLLVPALSKVARRTAYNQAAVDEAAVACALEGYRISQGSYPPKLEDLVPRFITRLPADVVSGQPLNYHRTEDGHFVLYSVGWNQKDDGGTVALSKTGSSVDEEQGDWVWR